jgi:hypothetical protein
VDLVTVSEKDFVGFAGFSKGVRSTILGLWGDAAADRPWPADVTAATGRP